MLFIGQVLPNHDVDAPGFIFQGDERNSAFRIRPLPTSNNARRSNQLTIPRILNVLCAGQAQRLELFAEQGERMTTER